MSRILSNQDGIEIDHMHTVYRQGGERRHMAPHVVYRDGECPHPGCTRRMQAIDFRLESFGRSVHDTLVRAWWSDVGFAGRCPSCDAWIHFTIRSKRAIDADEARALPQLPERWSNEAIIL